MINILNEEITDINKKSVNEEIQKQISHSSDTKDPIQVTKEIEFTDAIRKFMNI